MNKEILGAIFGVVAVGLTKHYLSGSKNDDEYSESEDDKILYLFGKPVKEQPIVQQQVEVLNFPVKQGVDYPEYKPLPDLFYKMFPGPHISLVPTQQEKEARIKAALSENNESMRLINSLRELAKRNQLMIESIPKAEIITGNIVEMPVARLGNDPITLREMAEMAQDPRQERKFVKNFGRVLLRIMKGYNLS